MFEHVTHCYVRIYIPSIFICRADDMPAGRTPATVNVMSHGALVEAVGAGERVRVTGVFRAAPAAVHPRRAAVRALHRTHLDALHYAKAHEHRLHDIEDGYAHFIIIIIIILIFVYTIYLPLQGGVFASFFL